MPHDILIVIPAKNEAISIEQVIREVKTQIGCKVVVIDDGSSDGTGEIALAAGAIVLSPLLPLGAWGAIQTGIRYALLHGFQIVITMDGDGQHESEAVQDLLDPIQRGDADAVIGACPRRGSPSRRVAWALFRRLSGFSLEDLTSGFRAYNRAAMKVLASEEATLLDYQDIGVLILLRKAGLHIGEVPVPMYPRAAGKSRIFGSWWAIGWYMLQTGVLCLARWNVQKNDSNEALAQVEAPNAIKKL